MCSFCDDYTELMVQIKSVEFRAESREGGSLAYWDDMRELETLEGQMEALEFAAQAAWFAGEACGMWRQLLVG